jgi:hypothetical protein
MAENAGRDLHGRLGRRGGRESRALALRAVRPGSGGGPSPVDSEGAADVAWPQAVSGCMRPG